MPRPRSETGSVSIEVYLREEDAQRLLALAQHPEVMDEGRPASASRVIREALRCLEASLAAERP